MIKPMQLQKLNPGLQKKIDLSEELDAKMEVFEKELKKLKKEILRLKVMAGG